MKRIIRKALVLICILSGISGISHTRGQPVVINGVAVPSGFPTITPTINNQTAPGYIFINNWEGSPYIIIFKNDGTPYYYKRVKERSRDFKVQPGNKLSRRVRRPAWGFIVMDSNFRDIDTLRCQNGFDTDEHELQLLPNGNALMIALEHKQIDMSKIHPGGIEDARVIGNHVQELDPDHNVVFEWICWDHYDISGSYEDLTRGEIDYIHMNSIAVDYDGHIVVSSRHLSECTKINRQTGEIIWRLGGKNNQFEFTNDADQISYQHDCRPVPGKPNHYTIFDNGNQKDPPYTRAVEFALDTVAMTAVKVWEYRHTPERYTHWMGNTQRLPNGNTFINWADGPLPKASEVTPEGEVVYEADFDHYTPVYRAFRFEWDGMMLEPYLIAEPYPDKVRLIFNKFGDEGVEHYRIYSGTDPEEIKLTDWTENTWIDLDPGGKGYYYFRVTAVDTSGNESLPSNTEYVYYKKVNYGDNLVQNGDFSEGDDNWILLNHSDASSTGTVDENGYTFSIQNGSNVEWHIQLIQENIPLIKDEEYVFRFDARAESPRIIDVKLETNGNPWTNYSHTGATFLTTEMQDFSFIFTMHDPTDLEARLTVNGGDSDIDFTINNVEVKIVDPTRLESAADRKTAGMDCYPNPSSGPVKIAYNLEYPSVVTIYLYDLTGKRIESINQGYREAGGNEFLYDTSRLTEGTYLIRLQAGDQQMLEKIVVTR